MMRTKSRRRGAGDAVGSRGRSAHRPSGSGQRCSFARIAESANPMPRATNQVQQARKSVPMMDTRRTPRPVNAARQVAGEQRARNAKCRPMKIPACATKISARPWARTGAAADHGDPASATPTRLRRAPTCRSRYRGLEQGEKPNGEIVPSPRADAGKRPRSAARRMQRGRSDRAGTGVRGGSRRVVHRLDPLRVPKSEDGSWDRPPCGGALLGHARGSCNALYMSWSRRRSARLSPRQSEGSADPRRARADRREGPGRLHLRGGRALGRRQPGRAVPAFPRPRRAAGRRSAARLRAVRRRAGARLGRRPARAVRGVRAARQGLSGVRAHRARLLFGDVRGRRSARRQPGIDGGRRPRLRGDAQGVRKTGRADAGREGARPR